jgi:hypothetical protein
MSEADQRVSEVEWGPPPKSEAEERVRYDWDKIAKQLRARPGEWAKIFEDDRTSVVNAIRQGAVKPLQPALGFEVRTRNNVRYPVRRCSLYLRYVPGKDTGRTRKRKGK